MRYKDIFNESIDRLVEREDLNEDQKKELIRQELRNEEIKNMDSLTESDKVQFNAFKQMVSISSAQELANFAKEIIDKIYED